MYVLKPGSEILPYCSETNETGTSRLSSIEVVFEDADILEVVTLEGKEYLKLSLGENPTQYDSYLIDKELLEL